MLMHADDRRVDHLHSGIMSASQCIHEPTPDARSTPANKAVVACGVRTECIGQVAPRCPRAQDPEDAIENTTVIHPRNATRLVRQHRLDGCPFVVSKFVAHDSSPQFGGLNHGPAAALNITLAANARPAFRDHLSRRFAIARIMGWSLSERVCC